MSVSWSSGRGSNNIVHHSWEDWSQESREPVRIDQKRSTGPVGGTGEGERRHQLTRVPLVNSLELQLRFLTPDDIEKVKVLCRAWFPIDYPDTWYQEITSNPRFYSLAATLQGRMIGLIVAETKELGNLAKEDRTILASCFRKGTKVGYILSLGKMEIAMPYTK